MYRKILNKTPLGFVEYMSELFQLCTGKMFSDRMCAFWEGIGQDLVVRFYYSVTLAVKVA